MEVRIPAQKVTEAEPAVVNAGGRWIAVFRVDDDFYAVEDTCPHQGNPLSMGEVRGRTLTCAFHGWRFDLETGFCVAGGAPVASFPVQLVDGEIVVDVPD